MKKDAKRRDGKSGRTGKETGKILKSKVLYKGRLFGVRRDEVLEPDGSRNTREVITHPGSVVVLPVLDDGRIDGKESPKEGAARELREETGYQAKRFTVFLDVFPTPGFLEENMYILLAEGLKEGKAEPEEDEKIISRPFSLKELKQMIQSGELKDAKSVAGILYYLTFLR